MNVKYFWNWDFFVLFVPETFCSSTTSLVLTCSLNSVLCDNGLEPSPNNNNKFQNEHLRKLSYEKFGY